MEKENKEYTNNNEPGKDFKEEIYRKKEEVARFPQEKNSDFIATKETFEGMIVKFEKSGKISYDFLTKSGPQFQDTIIMFCLCMFEEEQLPEEFQNKTLHMIFKEGKGRKEILSDSQFIHCKDFWACTAEGSILEDGLRAPLISTSSIYQIGGQPGHRPEELVFVMKSIIAKYRKYKKNGYYEAVHYFKVFF